MRRRHGTDLTSNEDKVLAATLRLTYESVDQLYGYELFSTLTSWEGSTPMNHGTLYRCLRSLEHRGLLTSEEEADTNERFRVFYRLTPDGAVAARKATIRLAALDRPPSWVDIGLARTPEDT